MKDKQKLIDLIDQYIQEPYQSSLKELIQPSIRFYPTDEGAAKIGETKFGGYPDLAPGVFWPKTAETDQYHTFLGQINLQDLHQFDQVQTTFPSKGLLSFFMDLTSTNQGLIHYTPDLAELTRLEKPDGVRTKQRSYLRSMMTGHPFLHVLNENKVHLAVDYQCPSWDSVYMDWVEAHTQSEIAPIYAFQEEFTAKNYNQGATEMTPNHRLLGRYKGIQNEFIELEFLEKSSEKYKTELARLEAAMEWKLLFQFDSDPKFNLKFLDAGRIYFFLHENDLIKNQFDRVRIAVDSY